MPRRVVTKLPGVLGCIVVACVSKRFLLTNASMLNALTSAVYVMFAVSHLAFALNPHGRAPTTTGQHDWLEGTIAESIYQDAHQAYAIYTDFPRARYFTGLMFSLLAWVAALQLLFAWLGTLGVSAFQAIRFASLWPSQAVAIIVALVGGVGLLVFVLSLATFFLTPRKPDVYIDGEGIHKGDATDEVFLPWEAVDGIMQSADDEGDVRYTVVGNYARAIIRWSTRNTLPPNPALPLPSVTPEQFAAMVAARSGKPLVMR